MILLLDTSTPICKLWLYRDGVCVVADEWHADRTLAERLLGYLQQKLEEQEAGWDTLTSLGVFRGPGSFTGLRIGISVLNTIADDRKIPIVGTTGEAWREEALKRLQQGQNDLLVLPEYGRPARITTPRK